MTHPAEHTRRCERTVLATAAPRCKSSGPSSDDFDAQPNLRYDVYLNGVLEDVRFGSSGPVIAYGQFGENTIEVFASDTSGNRSEPATTTISF
jgi:hypothetical protein